MQILADKLLWVSILLAFFPSQILIKQVRLKAKDLIKNKLLIEGIDILIRVIIVYIVWQLIQWSVKL